MIEYENKDIVDVDQGIIGHQVNCQGVMNSGVAKQIRNKWPVVFERYKQAVDIFPEIDKGFAQVIQVDQNLYVANIFGQQNYGKDKKMYTNLNMLHSGLVQIFEVAQTLDLPVYLPMIGCGLGGASWDAQVKPMIEQLVEQFEPKNCTVCIKQ